MVVRRSPGDRRGHADPLRGPVQGLRGRLVGPPGVQPSLQSLVVFGDDLHQLGDDRRLRSGIDQLAQAVDRKSTRLNSSTNAHLVCRLLLEKKNTKNNTTTIKL